MKSIIQKFVLMIAVSAVIFTGCNNEENDPVVPTFSPAHASVTEGSIESVGITAGVPPFTLSYPNNAPFDAAVSDDNSSVIITGKSEGIGTIIVTGSDGGKGNLPVTVNAKDPDAPELSESVVQLSINDDDATATVLIIGGTAPFTASSNNLVATASVNNRTVTVTANTVGVAVITVTGADGASSSFAVDAHNEQILFGPDGTQLGSGNRTFHITKSHTIRKGTYTLVGWIYVEEGAVLTIEPGTVFKASNHNFDGEVVATGSSLIIKRGGKIMAEGTREEPIVFTSAQPAGQRQPADWGGIIILGRATNNGGNNMTVEGGVDGQHGGTDDNDNSGILKFVRIEFAGYPYAQDNEINGLTLGSVGRGTTLEYIQVSYCGDDSYEWFGGTVDARFLVSYHAWDDDFDPDQGGFRGRIQFALAVRDPKIADTSNSNGIETDNRSDGGTQTPNTKAIFSNVTVIGPMGQDPDFVNRGETAGQSTVTGYGWSQTSFSTYAIRTGIFQAGMHIRRNSHTSVFNSVFTGFPVGLILDNQNGNSHGAATAGDLKIKNVFFAGMGRLAANNNNANEQWTDAIGSTGATLVVADYFNRPELNNTAFTPASQSYEDIVASIEELGLSNFQSKVIPLPNTGFAPNNLNANWGPVAGSPLLAPGAADFTDALLQTNDNFFTPTSYAGAFASDNLGDSWLRGWTNFDPQNTAY